MLIVLVTVVGCRSTRYVPDGKFLLNNIEIELDEKSLDEGSLMNYVRQQPNAKVLGVARVKLGIYNLSSKKRTKGGLKKVGEAPVVFDPELVDRTKKDMTFYLHNKGFYDAFVSDSIIFHRKRRKVEVRYNVTPGRAYKIKNVDYRIVNQKLDSIVQHTSFGFDNNSGERFDIESLEEEREAMAKAIVNHGYFGFGPDMITIEADTVNREVDFVWEIDNLKNKQGDELEFKKWKINTVTIFADYENTIGDSLETSLVEKKTINEDGLQIVYSDELEIKPSVLANVIPFRQGHLYSQKIVEKAYNALSSIRQYKFVNIFFKRNELTDADGNGLLDCVIQLSPQSRQNYSVNLEWTNSSGDMGVGGALKYGHKNLFNGAEVFNMNVKGGLERKSERGDAGQQNVFNTRELGVDASLSVPKFFMPFLKLNAFQYSVPKTRFSLSYNYQKRPDYTRTIASSKFGYTWKDSRFKRHQLNVVDFSVVNLSKIDPDFLASIRDINILSSYIDHLIFALNYSYTYNTQTDLSSRNYSYLRFGVESSGNLLYGINWLLNSEKEVIATDAEGREQKSYHMLGTPFSQYLKADVEYRHSYRIDNVNTVVFRGFAGIGIPFGNSSSLPFEKRYFTGGANGIRAWSIRSLGPGNYSPGQGDYPNAIGDIKLEANAEYRFKMFWKLEGALFLDCGNIWTLENENFTIDNTGDVVRDASVQTAFNFSNFFNQIAVGTGVGLRVNLSYFVFRLDLGLKLRDPALPEGKRWSIATQKLTADDYNLSFAIGYPF